MDQQNGFYCVLPSNSSMSTFPDNTLSSYHVVLPARIRLKGPWEMALVEMQYPTRVANVNHVDYSTIIAYRTPEGMKYFFVPVGHYPTPRKLCQAIKKAVKAEQFAITYNKATQRVHVTVREDRDPRYTLRFSHGLGNMLGFKLGRLLSSRNNVADYPTDVHSGVHNYYVYVDTAEHVMVGDVRAPLLRIVPIEYEDTNATTKTVIFNSPHYIPVRRNETETIEVNITDDTGRSISFTHGKTYIKVHFRPCQPDYLH